ncbi:MAG: acyltransferase [Prevotella sp.]|nr:acyltransferase [Prevotella sp.]
MATARKHFYQEIDIIKGVAILLVLLAHSGGVKYISMDQYGWYNIFTGLLRDFSMPPFFIISGFLFGNSGRKPFWQSMKSKVDRLVVPYFVMSFIILGVRLLAPALFNRPTGNLGVALILIFFYGYWYWFIYTLFILHVVFTLARPKLTPRIAVVLMVVLLVIREMHLAHIGFLKIHQAIYFGFFFLLGYIIHTHYARLKKWLAHPYTIIILSLVYVLGCYYCLTDHIGSLLYYWLMPVCFSLAIWGVCIRLVPFTHLNKAFSYCGKYSLQFYLFNGFTLGVSREIFVRVLHVYHPKLLMALVFVSTLMLSVAIVETIRRMPKVKYFFGFGKPSKNP